jgi:hypothetical protein
VEFALVSDVLIELLQNNNNDTARSSLLRVAAVHPPNSIFQDDALRWASTAEGGDDDVIIQYIIQALQAETFDAQQWLHNLTREPTSRLHRSIMGWAILNPTVSLSSDIKLMLGFLTML